MPGATSTDLLVKTICYSDPAALLVGLGRERRHHDRALSHCLPLPLPRRLLLLLTSTHAPTGTDNEIFWQDMQDRHPRALKWRDSPYPHMDILRNLFEEHGDGLEPMPELNEPITMPESTPVRKRVRESTPEGSYSAKVSHPSIPIPEVSKLATMLQTSMSNGFAEVLALLSTMPVYQDAAKIQARKLAMEELSNEQYARLMSNAEARSQALELFRDVSAAVDFLLYPQPWRHIYLEEQLNKMAK